MTLVEGFSDVYDKALLKTKGKRSLANNLIWQSIRLPEAKGSKKVKNVDKSCPKASALKQSDSEDGESLSEREKVASCQNINSNTIQPT